jgi:hypothetical protein
MTSTTVQRQWERVTSKILDLYPWVWPFPDRYRALMPHHESRCQCEDGQWCGRLGVRR